MRSRQDRQPDNINVLGYRGGPALIRLINASHVTLRGMSVRAAAQTAVSILGGEHVTVGGATLRDSRREERFVQRAHPIDRYSIVAKNKSLHGERLILPPLSLPLC